MQNIDKPLDQQQLEICFVKISALILRYAERDDIPLSFAKELTKILKSVDANWIDRQDVKQEREAALKAKLR
jgi:hypothetical protein